MAIALLGNDAVLVGLSAIVYWCFDKPRGRLVTYILLFGAYVNLFLKTLVPWPRPPVDLRIIDKNETSYGFPSGHAQDSTTFWTWISLDFRKRILGVLGAAIVPSVGISRIYLGLHYPAQVIGGWAIGLAVAGVGMIALQHLPPRKNEISLVPQVVFAIAALIPLGVAATLVAVGETNPGQIGGYLFGFSLGALAEDRYVRFTTDVSVERKILRVAIGSAITGFLVLALAPIFPDTSMSSSFLNSVIRGFAVVLIAPAAFSMVERTNRISRIL